MNARVIPTLALAACLLLAGCHNNDTSSPSNPPAATPQDEAAASNQLFLNQKTFDPWVLSTDDRSTTRCPFIFQTVKRVSSRRRTTLQNK